MKRALLLVLFACLIALAACGGTPPEEEPDLVATQVAVERAAAATLTAEAIAAAPSPTEAQTTPTQVVATVPPIIILPTPGSGTPQPTLVPPPTPTPTQIAGQIQPVFTPTRATPAPTPTQITAVVFPVDGSDGNQALRGSVIQSNGGRNVLLLGIDQAQVTTPMIFRERLPVRVEVFDDTIGTQDGDGIAAVDFDIRNTNGDTVLRTIEETAPYCLWGGNDLNCPAPSFAELGYTWPQTGAPINNDFYDAAIVITGTNDTSITWFWTFEIDHGGQAAAPVEVVLRPACGNQVNAPANTPIDLIYGIWANRGQSRAVANAPYTETDLVIDGQNVAGDVVQYPVADLPQAICGRDYEDSYWVYSRTQLPPLTPGVHYVQVRYTFTQAVDDGYGSTYTQPFTQQYQIVVE
ncbi:MAG: hypothetical protein KDD84_17205 [Caldilineaceae bacterium]|nr:hypothetical protein [Caldilineaceae bacterium]